MTRPVRVRFAPSPTGYLHVGGARTALFNWLFARAQGGQFLLRIEDTDQTRYSPEALHDLLRDLKWLGLQWDEGEGVGGPHGPYTQSQRLPLYQKAAEELIAKGAAYRCFCSAERLEALRAEQTAAGKPTGYDRCCRNIDPGESLRRAQAGEPFVVRLKVPETGETTFHDLLRGDITTPNAQLDDMVLLKRDGFPTYHMANVVDDHDMEITHILRGDEWIPSTSRHLLLYRAFGWEPPQFVHLPVILSPSGGKLSKRKGAASVGDFRDKGYLPEALFNFLALLGWGPGDDRELMTKEEMVSAFTLDRISPKSSAFDETKLEWFNEQTIQRLPVADLVPRFREVLGKAGVDLSGQDDARLARIVEAVRPRVRLLGDFVAQAAWYFRAPSEYDPKGVKRAWKEGTSANLDLVAGALASWTGPAEDEALGAMLHGLCEANGLGPGQVMMPLRLALCGALIGPDVSSIVAELGTEESVRRVRAAQAALSAK